MTGRRSSARGWKLTAGRPGPCLSTSAPLAARWWRWMRVAIRRKRFPGRFARQWTRMIVRKTAGELEKMRRSGLLVWQILEKLREAAVEGACTMDLETAAEKMISGAGARPAFKGYYVPAAGEAYRFVLCTSLNSEIVHGMPSAKRVLKSGDIVSIDTGVS